MFVSLLVLLDHIAKKNRGDMEKTPGTITIEQLAEYLRVRRAELDMAANVVDTDDARRIVRLRGMELHYLEKWAKRRAEKNADPSEGTS